MFIVWFFFVFPWRLFNAFIKVVAIFCQLFIMSLTLPFYLVLLKLHFGFLFFVIKSLNSYASPHCSLWSLFCVFRFFLLFMVQFCHQLQVVLRHFLIKLGVVITKLQQCCTCWLLVVVHYFAA